MNLRMERLGIFGESRSIAEIPLDELLGMAVRLAEPAEGPFADDDLCVGEAMEGLDWVTEEHIQALCRAAGIQVLAALLAAGYTVQPPALGE